MKYEIDVKTVKEKTVEHIRQWFTYYGESKCVIGMPDDLEALVVAALCKEALGYKRVIAVIMPDGEDEDISKEIQVAQELGIYYITASIDKAIDGIFEPLVRKNNLIVSVEAEIDLPRRVRTAMLHAVAQSMNGCVVGLTYDGEDIWTGDEFLTYDEMKALALELGLSEELVNRY